MPTLEIQGREVEVGDGFLKLSSKDQNDVVMQIASSLGIKSKEPSGSSQLGDIVKGIGGGLVRGAAGTVGMVTDTLPNALVAGSDYLAKKLPGVDAAEYDRQAAQRDAAYDASQMGRTLSTKSIQGGIESVTGPAYEPETRAGKIASRAAEFVPGGMIGRLPNIVRNAVAYGAVPGAVSEIAGQAFEGGPMETPARIAGGLAGGIGSAMAMRNGPAANMVRSSLDGVSPQQLDAAEQLFARAEQSGTPISRAEAIQAVTGGATKIGDLQHTVEGMGGLKDFYAQRPAQNQAAARNTFDTIAPGRADPSQIGAEAGRAGEATVQGVRDAINRTTRPLYEAGGQHLVPEQVHAAMMADPLFAETFNTVRRDPARNALVQGANDRSVRMYDAVAKELEQRSQNAAQPLNPQASQAIASTTGRLGGDIKDVAIASERAATNGPSSYEAALANQARLRQQYLTPVLNGPIGKVAGQDTTTKSAIDALFPANPLPNSQDEIAQSLRALSRQRPGIANDLVRAHAEMTFNEAAQRLASGGANQSGGAKFAAVLRGNEQQASNLEASIRALPHGDATWRGFDNFLSLMEAQQYRQATGSRTAFKIPGVEDLKSGGIANNAAQVVGGAGFNLPKKVMGAIQNWNTGRNLDELAYLLTSPEASERFRQLSRLPPTSTQFASVASRLATLAIESKRSATDASK